MRGLTGTISKNMVAIIFTILVLATPALVISGIDAAGEGGSSGTLNSVTEASQKPGDYFSGADFEEIAGNDRLVLYANKELGEVAVYDRKTGETWFSNPPGRDEDVIASGFFKVSLASQVLIRYAESRNIVLDRGSFLHCVQKGGLSHEVGDGYIIFRYDFVNDGIIVPVMYSIGDEYFSATVLTDEVMESDGSRLISIDLLPYFGAGGLDDDGYMMIPDGSGALIHMNNGKTYAADYQAPIYGVDQGSGGLQIPPSAAWLTTIINKEQIRIPAFGMKKNDTGYLAIIASSAPRAEIKAVVSGKGTSYNSVYSQLKYRMSGTVLLTQKEFSERKSTIYERLSARGTPYEVRYYFLDSDDSDYVGMAESFRKYQESECGLVKRVKDGELPLYLDLYGYINKTKPVLGIPVEKVITLTTIDDMRDITEKLRDKGIANVIIKYNNWAKGASFEKIPVKAEFERKIGSAKDFAAFERDLAETGGSVYLASDLINVYKTGNGFRKYTDALRSVANTPLIQVKYVLDSAAVDSRVPSWYLLSPLRFGKFFSRHMDNLSKAGAANIGFDNLGSMLYSDMGRKGVSRTDVPYIVGEVLENAAARFSSVMLTGGNAYVAPYAEHVVGVPSRSSHYDIIDEHIPFYHIVYHGMVNYTLAASNLSSNPEHTFLKCLETGAAPMYAWVGKNSEELINSRLDHLYSADYNLWMDFAVSDYKKIESVLSQVRTELITAHERIAEGMYRTTYGDRLSVIVNYNHERMDVDGISIEGYGYLVKEAGD